MTETQTCDNLGQPETKYCMLVRCSMVCDSVPVLDLLLALQWIIDFKASLYGDK